MKIKAVTFILQREDGQVLMEWRTDGVFAPGHWSFPGGRVESGEDLYVAFCREADEELGIFPNDWTPLEPFEYRGWGIQPYHVISWLCSRSDLPEAVLDSGAKLAWFTLEECMAMPWVPVVRMARQVLGEQAA